MTRQIYIVLADFLDMLGNSAEPVEVGQAGPSVSYRRGESKKVGPAVAGLAADGLIVAVDAQRSCRPSRHGGLARRWQALSPAACRQKAQELRQKAERLDDDGNDLRQPTLF